MKSVVVRSVSKLWGDARAVDNVSFDVEPGTLAVLLGPSGCGKSTTLRMIAGLDEPTSGVIEIAGKDVTGLTGSSRGVAMVFQSYALFPHLTVADNITFGLSVRGTPKAEMATRLAKVAALLGLGPLLARKPSQLSGGQQQRVALGRALIAEAPVCLLDEPLSNLDAQLRQELRHEIRALQQRLGITMVYVTHDQTEAMSMADRVILMRGGKIEQNGTPADLYERPANIFTAKFIGTAPMSFLDLDGGRFLGLRAEDIAVSRDTAQGVHATVTSVEYLGAEALVTCTLGERPVLARTRGAGAPAVGARVALSWEPAAAHVFDASSGNRLAIDQGAAIGPSHFQTLQSQGSINA